jgi:hypothetical protein
MSPVLPIFGHAVQHWSPWHCLPHMSWQTVPRRQVCDQHGCELHWAPAGTVQGRTALCSVGEGKDRKEKVDKKRHSCYYPPMGIVASKRFYSP